MVFRQLELGFTLKGKQDKSVRFINFTFFFFSNQGKVLGKLGEKRTLQPRSHKSLRKVALHLTNFCRHG